VSRSVQFNDKLITFAKHWGFRPRACAPYRARTKSKTENGVHYVKKNVIAGHSFASWEAFETHLAEWEGGVANVRIHGTTGVAPITRFACDEVTPVEAARRRSDRRANWPASSATIVLSRSTRTTTVPWRLISERVAVTVAAGEVRIHHGMREVAVTGS